MTREDFDKIADALFEVMREIRADVAMGNGPDIEADAVVMNVGQEIAVRFGDHPEFDRAAFDERADLNNPIPSEAFRV